MQLQEVLVPLIQGLAEQEAVQAVAVVGSRMSGYATAASDIDLFVYVDRTHEELLAFRHDLADRLADPERFRIVGQPGHPETDVWALSGGGPWLDVMFWGTTWAEEELDWRLVRMSAQIGGASTAFWRSIRGGIPLYDRTGWLSQLQERARAPYPEPLRSRIVRHNRELLGRDNPFSFYNQATKAVAERDAFAAQHRAAAWLTCYFDLLFAVNRVLHPDEKRLVAIAQAECAETPDGFGSQVERLISMSCQLDDGIDQHMDEMLKRLDEVTAATAVATSSDRQA